MPVRKRELCLVSRVVGDGREGGGRELAVADAGADAVVLLLFLLLLVMMLNFFLFEARFGLIAPCS